jgi:hypothetical protein
MCWWRGNVASPKRDGMILNTVGLRKVNPVRDKQNNGKEATVNRALDGSTYPG